MCVCVFSINLMQERKCGEEKRESKHHFSGSIGSHTKSVMLFYLLETEKVKQHYNKEFGWHKIYI